MEEKNANEEEKKSDLPPTEDESFFDFSKHITTNTIQVNEEEAQII
jgi:hypothetical protein